MTNPIVSICCVTYNHAKFIRKALEGFLMQEPPTGVSADEPWYEILIHDDASTDGTTEIVKEYATKYPDRIFPLYETENQYSRGADVDYFNFSRVRGKYVAYCEGDDYWIDPQKLQKQFDFMEAHPEMSICFHKANVLTDNEFDSRLYENLEEREYSAAEIYKDWLVPTCSIFFKSEYLSYVKNNPAIVYGDIYLFLTLAEHGKIYNLNFSGAVYRRNSGGVSQKGNAEIYKKLLGQYEYMEKRFLTKDLVCISRNMQEMYLKCIISSPIFQSQWKYRLKYMNRHPHLWFTRFGLVTIYHAIKGK